MDEQQKRHSGGSGASGAYARPLRVRAPDRRQLEHRRCRKKTLDLTDEGFRHLFLEVGPTTVLHPFQLLDGPAPPMRDTGTAWIMDVHDPDGLYGEVIWHKSGARAAEMLRHEDRTTVRLS